MLGLTAIVAYAAGNRAAAAWFGLGGVVYFRFGMILTVAVNVPMNEALALVQVPEDCEAAAAIWRNYFAPCQFWNTSRAVASGLALLFAGLGAMPIGDRATP